MPALQDAAVSAGRESAASVTGRAADGNPTRRALFRGAAGVGAAGVAAAALSGLGARGMAGRASAGHAAEADLAGGADDRDTGAGTEAAEQIVVHVKDAAGGRIDLYRGAALVRLHDPELARRLTRLSGP